MICPGLCPLWGATSDQVSATGATPRASDHGSRASAGAVGVADPEADHARGSVDRPDGPRLLARHHRLEHRDLILEGFTTDIEADSLDGPGEFERGRPIRCDR